MGLELEFVHIYIYPAKLMVLCLDDVGVPAVICRRGFCFCCYFLSWSWFKVGGIVVGHGENRTSSFPG